MGASIARNAGQLRNLGLITLRTLADLQLSQQIVRIFSDDELGNVDVYAPFLSVDWSRNELQISLVIDRLPKVKPKRWPDGPGAMFAHLRLYFDSISIESDKSDAETSVDRFRVSRMSLNVSEFDLSTSIFRVHATNPKAWMDDVYGVGGITLDDIGRKVGKF